MFAVTNIMGLLTTVGISTLAGQFVINEIDADTPGTDNAEFVELYQVPGPGSSSSLSGHVLVFFNGTDPSDSAYLVVDLDTYSFSPSGFFVVGGSGVPNVDLAFPPGSNYIENGTDAVALYNGATAVNFLNEIQTTPIDNGDLVDFLIYRGGTEEDTTFSSAFPPSEQPDEDANGSKDLDSIQRNPDGESAFSVALPSPGSTNFRLPRIVARPSPVQVNEDTGTGAFTVYLTREGDLSSSLNVNIVAFGALSRISAPPTSAFFPVGQEEVSFVIDTIPNSSVNGSGFIELGVSEDSGPGDPSYESGTAILIVADDEIAYPLLVINELLVKGDGSGGAEFVELYNNGNTAVSLDGFNLRFYAADPEGGFGSLQQSITIPSGTIPAKGFFTIGNSEVSSVYGASPNLTIPGLELPDEDSCAVLFNSGGGVVFSSLMQDGEADAVPNISGSPLAANVLVVAEGDASPAGYYLTTNGGQEAQKLEFVDVQEPAPSATPVASNVVEPRLLLSGDLALIAEDSSDVVTFTVSRIPDTVGDLTVTLFSNDTTELVVPASVVIPDGQASATFTGIPQLDGIRDGLRVVTVTGSAAGLQPGAVEATVLDSDIPDLAVCDIAFLAAIAVDPDVFAFVALTDLFAGTRIGFTDDGWRASGSFLGEEESLTWFAIADVPAGTVVTFTGNVPDVGFASGGTIELGTNGDQIFAYQGEKSSPTFLAGIQLNGAWDSDATNTSTSSLPSALSTEGAVAIDPERDNAVYTASTEGTLSELKSLLFSTGSFASSNDREVVGPLLIPASFTISEGVEYTVQLSSFSISGGQATLAFSATGASDVYVSQDLLNWSTATNGAGVASGSYTDTAPPAGKAFYLIQEAGAEAP